MRHVMTFFASLESGRRALFSREVDDPPPVRWAIGIRVGTTLYLAAVGASWWDPDTKDVEHPLLGDELAKACVSREDVQEMQARGWVVLPIAPAVDLAPLELVKLRKAVSP